MKLIKGLIFGVDLFDGLVWFVLLTLGFWLFGGSFPHGYERLIAVLIACLAAILPDFDMVPYLLIRKNKPYVVLALVLVWFAITIAVMTLFSKSSIGFLGAVGCFAWAMAASAPVRKKVMDRASHWPIWHHPVLVLAICFGLVWAFATNFAPQHRLYYELLVVPLVAAHFLHDGLQSQGFPFLSPFTDAHYQWQFVGFERISPVAVRHHYMAQAACAESQTAKQDVERRADTVTSMRVILLGFAGCAALATLLFL